MELVERAAQLEALGSLLDDVISGAGRAALVRGEAGAGKSSLVAGFCDSAAGRAASLWGTCEPLSAPRPLGPLVDMAARLGDDVVVALRSGVRDAIFDATLASLNAPGPGRILVFEDVHWADESTLDLLQIVSRRLHLMRVLVVMTYRDDQLSQAHPLRLLLGDVAAIPAVRRIEVPALSPAAVRTLAADTDIDADVLHRDTGGNAFFVTEVLSNGADAIPATVSDAVLARVGRLPPDVRSALEAAAVLGPRLEASVLLLMNDVDASLLDDGVTAGMLQFHPPHYLFRHELARQAVLASIPPRRLAELHREALRLLRTSEQTADHYSRLAHHAEEAADASAVVEFATKAAAAAAGLQSHREAAFQYGRALRFADDVGDRERVDLLEQRAYECYLVDLLNEAVDARREAVEVWTRMGEPLHVAENLRLLSRVWWVAGNRQEAERAADQALDVLGPLEPGPELSRAYATQAQLHMLAHDSEGAVEWGRRAIDLAEQIGDTPSLVNALNTVGTVRLEIGEGDGEQMLGDSLRRSLAAGLEDDAARAWTNLSACLFETFEFAKARAYLADGAAYCREHDLYSAGLCMEADRVLHLLYLGRWDEAAEAASALLDQRVLARISRITPLLVLGRIHARRGDRDPWPMLDEALTLAGPTGELQWLSAAAAARAEAHWIADRPDRVEPELREVYDLALTRQDPFSTGDLATWLRRVGALEKAPVGVRRPFQLQLSGDPMGAADAWREVGFPFEAALSLIDSGTEADLRKARAELDGLGATAVSRLVARRLKAMGATRIERGHRASTRANPARLTNREVEVLQLLQVGLRDSEIATSLSLSTRTVSHHVSAILAKLQVGSRDEAADRSRDLLSSERAT